jgi:PmbA protein
MSFHETQDYIAGKLSKQKGDFALISEAGKDVVLKFKDTKVTSRRNSRDSLRAIYSRGSKIKILNFNLKGDLDAQIKALTKGLKKDPNFKGVLPSPKYRKVNNRHDSDLNDFDGTTLLNDAIDLAFQYGADKIEGAFTHGASNIRLVTSGGADFDFDLSKLSMSMRAFVNDASASKVISSSNLGDFNYRQKIGEVLDLAKQSVSPERFKPGEYSLVLDPLAFSYIINEFGHAHNFLKRRVGKAVGSEGLTMYDVGNLRGGMGSASFDSYGHPTRATEIISSGVLKTVVHNPLNFVVPIGKRSRAKIISSVDKGLLITNFRNAKRTKGKLDLKSKDAAFVIDKGHVIGSVRQVNLSDDMLKILSGFSDSSNTKERILNPNVPTAVELPTVRIDGLKVA